MTLLSSSLVIYLLAEYLVPAHKMNEDDWIFDLITSESPHAVMLFISLSFF